MNDSGDKTMEKNYIVCLDNIIELEKSVMVKEKLIDELDTTISELAIPKQINKPQKSRISRPSVQYQAVESFDLLKWGPATFIVIAVIAVIYIMAIAEGFLDFLAGIFLGFLCVWPVLAACLIVEFVIYIIAQSIIDGNRERQATIKAEQKYQQMLEANEKEYKYSIQKYNELLKFEDERLFKETQQKQEFIRILEETVQKNEASKELLNTYYDTLDIYPTYRNLVAICHICEYLKSGICTELTGPNGAFMVYKTEMYEKMKIERLDNIVSSLEQLHFDNQILNRCLDAMNQQLFYLNNEIQDMRADQADAMDRMNQSLINIGATFEDIGEQVIRQNQISAYNQECALNEIKYYEQLNYWKNR